MKIKINDKVFCFPPYISTTWSNIQALQVETDPISRADLLVVTLADSSKIKIPHLDKKIMQAIFAAHLKYIETHLEVKEQATGQNMAMNMGVPFRLGVGGMENLGAALQHNPAQKELPDMPPDVLEKITSIARIVGPDEALTMSKPEEDCNCLHCQIARAIHTTFGEEQPEIEEEVTDAELQFRTWDITQNGAKLYTVINPLNSQEQYNVYLGDPIGCTCGEKGCAHIEAVLKS